VGRNDHRRGDKIFCLQVSCCCVDDGGDPARGSARHPDHLGLALRNSSGSFATLAAMRRASTVEEVNSDTRDIAGNSHRDHNRCCNIDTEKPSDRCANNRNSPNHKRRSDKSPVLSGLGGGPSAFLRRMSVHESERPCAVGLHSQAT